MSKREELRKRRQQQARRTQLTIVAGIVVVAVAVVGYIAYQNYQTTLENSKPVGAFVSIGSFFMSSPQSPRAMPSERATCTNTLSAGTVRTLLMVSANGTNFRSGG